MDEAGFHALLSPEGRRLLAAAEAAAPADATRLRVLTRLRRGAPPAVAGAALETAMLRRRAAAKFSRAHAMYFTRDALEQATGELVAAHCARRFAGRGRVVDLGCGIGGDTIALASVAEVVGVDRDRLRLLMARENTRAYGVAGRAAWVQADISGGGPVRADVAFVDPSRRASGRRVFRADAYAPPLREVLSWRERFAGMAVKVAPGIADEDVAGLPGEVEFIAERNDLKEAVVWLGDLAGRGRRATVLPAGATLSAEVDLPAPAAPAGAVLYEPNPAVIRAHLIGTLAAKLGAWQIDPTIAYLSADTALSTPFARSWQVDAVLSFSVDGVRRHLRALGVGRITVKKRGSPVEPAAFARMLRLSGPEERTVVLTHQLGRPVALICRDRSLSNQQQATSNE
jgi:protein-L-isoaspartate O-methyltransferase